MPNPLVSYIDAISEYHPGVQASLSNDGMAYEDISWLGGTALPSKETLDADVTRLTLTRKWDQIKAERDRRTQEGGSKVNNYWFHSDQSSRTQQIALVILGAGLPPGIMWKSMSGAFVPMTPVLAQQIFGAAVMLDQRVFGAAEVHRQQMMASPTPWSYEFVTGWPQTYDEAKAAGQTP